MLFFNLGLCVSWVSHNTCQFFSILIVFGDECQSFNVISSVSGFTSWVDSFCLCYCALIVNNNIALQCLDNEILDNNTFLSHNNISYLKNFSIKSPLEIRCRGYVFCHTFYWQLFPFIIALHSDSVLVIMPFIIYFQTDSLRRSCNIEWVWVWKLTT